MTQAEDLARIIEAHRFRYANEDELQEGIAAVLTSKGVAVEREVRLSTFDRIDLLIGDVGIEVKVTGAGSSVGRQLARYATSDRIAGLILVTNRLRHLKLAGVSHGKPVLVVPVVNP